MARFTLDASIVNYKLSKAKTNQPNLVMATENSFYYHYLNYY